MFSSATKEMLFLKVTISAMGQFGDLMLTCIPQRCIDLIFGKGKPSVFLAEF